MSCFKPSISDFVSVLGPAPSGAAVYYVVSRLNNSVFGLVIASLSLSLFL